MSPAGRDADTARSTRALEEEALDLGRDSLDAPEPEAAPRALEPAPPSPQAASVTDPRATEREARPPHESPQEALLRSDVRRDVRPDQGRATLGVSSVLQLSSVLSQIASVSQERPIHSLRETLKRDDHLGSNRMSS